MVNVIAKHVGDCVDELRRGLQQSGMIVVGEESPAAPHDAVERPRQADIEPLHTARERLAVVCFDNQMQVVSENAEVDEPQAKAAQRSGNCVASKISSR